MCSVGFSDGSPCDVLTRAFPLQEEERAKREEEERLRRLEELEKQRQEQVHAA